MGTRTASAFLEHRGSQRVAQRNTEKDRPGLPDCFGNHKGHKGKARRGGPCVRVRRTSGLGACWAWRASHAMLWGWGRGGRAAPENGACRRNAPNLPRPQKTENGAPLRATEESGDVGRSPTEKAKPLSLQASKLPPKSPGGCRGFGEVRSAYQLMAAGMPS